jgi:hypothetical protein
MQVKNKVVKNCLLCGGETKIIIDLGKTPLANNFTTEKVAQKTFPLRLVQCQHCQHVQLDYIVHRKTLFENYLYVSGTPPVNVKHFQDYAHQVIEKFQLNEHNLVCDVASNDGCFLQNFKNTTKIVGVDPAKNIAEEANQNGIYTIADFFSTKLAKEIKQNHGFAKVITCNNMLAHNMDIKDIVKGVKALLDPQGTFIFENSYLLDIVNFDLIDLVYHEHIHHFHIYPLVKFFNQLGMDIYHVERLPNHGGSIRVYVCFQGQYPIDPSVQQCLELEKEIPNKIKQLAVKIEQLKEKINTSLLSLHSQGKKIGVFGFPAKATTLIYGLGINMKTIDFIVDDAKLKQGKFIPSQSQKKSMVIEPPSVIVSKNPDYLLILAWNFADSIIENCKKQGYTGKFIVPLPQFSIKGEM